MWHNMLGASVHQGTVGTIQSFCSPGSWKLIGVVGHKQEQACINNLNIYRSSISPLWEHHTQYLIIYRMDLVLLLLLMTFRNTLLSYCLTLIRIITTTDIPARRNTLSTRTRSNLIQQQHIQSRKPRGPQQKQWGDASYPDPKHGITKSYTG